MFFLLFFITSGPPAVWVENNYKSLKVNRDFPVFSTPSAHISLENGSYNREKRIFEGVDYIALKGDILKFSVVKSSGKYFFFKVSSNRYPCKSCWIDSRAVSLTSQIETEPKIPGKNDILSRLRKTANQRYCWGCNLSQGIPQISKFYKLKTDSWMWRFEGLDCSGLLYEATDSYTPRNSIDMIKYGEKVPVQGKSPKTIAGMLKPLDLIVWPGHVIIVLDNSQTIDAVNFDGKKHVGRVLIRDLEKNLRRLSTYRTPVNDFYSSPIASPRKYAVRRWYPE
ncbi:hypothetical protein KKF34_15325 [Myxococcota bacterium]|nr:hypothetical protein [Myxococcota bacterium]MBU1383075.1 hypothetical protein [Myxococcota bacterium]MBU1498248.1 hypothetical protein [Myxococcota bacterium]